MKHIVPHVLLAVVSLFPGVARGEEESKAPHEQLRALDWLVGQWVHEGVQQGVSRDGSARELVHRVHLCCMWAFDKQVFVSLGVETVDNRVTYYSLTLTGWHAEEKQMMQFGLDTLGRYGDATLRLTDDASIGRHRMFLPDGRLFKTTHTMKRIDDNSHTLQFTDSTADGMEMPDSPRMLFKRVEE